MKPTFKEQYDKIVGAYLKNELRPLTACACFVGNLLNKKADWVLGRTEGANYNLIRPRDNPTFSSLKCIKEQSADLYTLEEIAMLERTFLTSIGNNWDEIENSLKQPEGEELLFKAMETTLQALKELHEAKGEIVEEYNFTKRELIPA